MGTFIKVARIIERVPCSAAKVSDGEGVAETARAVFAAFPSSICSIGFVRGEMTLELMVWAGDDVAELVKRAHECVPAKYRRHSIADLEDYPAGTEP